MNIINKIDPTHLDHEDYVNSPVIDLDARPDLDEVHFNYFILALAGNASVEILLLSSDDGGSWTNVGPASVGSINAGAVSVSWPMSSPTVVPCGISGSVVVNLKSYPGRYKKFGFNVNGDGLDVWCAGLVVV